MCRLSQSLRFPLPHAITHWHKASLSFRLYPFSVTGSPHHGVLSHNVPYTDTASVSHSYNLTVIGPSYTVAWSRTVTLVPPYILPHRTLLLTECLLCPCHLSLGDEAGLAGTGARSRGAGRAHKGAAAERHHARASGRWSPALDWSGVGHAGNAF